LLRARVEIIDRRAMTVGLSCWSWWRIALCARSASERARFIPAFAAILAFKLVGRRGEPEINAG
jgi:hypothetical protein